MRASALFAARDIIAPPQALRLAPKFRSQNSPSGAASSEQDELCLLVAWSDPFTVFTGNLADRIHGRVVPALQTTSQPDHSFWYGVDLPTPLPRRGLLDSVFAHAALLGLLYAVSIWPQSAAHLDSQFSRRALDGYTLSQYLPEIHGAPTRHRAVGKHDPVLASQEISSLPDAPDNLRQTIVLPPEALRPKALPPTPKLDRDFDLANFVAYQALPPVQPLAASTRESASLRLPSFIPEVIAPTVDPSALRSQSRLPSFQTRVIEPAPDVAQANPRLALPAFQPKVVEPAPDLGKVSRGTATNLAHLTPPIAAPVSPSPHVDDPKRASGQIIALSLHPAEVHAPLVLPPANRRGAFATSPNGRAGATGTPGTEASSGTGALQPKAPVNAPAGINVAAAPAATAPGASSKAPERPSAPADPNLRAKFMAAMHPPAISIPPHQPVAHESTAPRTELENRIFAGRRSYTLSVNMPNLNTATGSWIIHFVEREPGAASSPIAAPEVVSKFDPAYPGDLIQDGVQGTVILTAVIRADGSVGDIAIAKSLDPRLDQNAAHAFSQWLFRPALKNGQAIDLQAVITVPFRAKATGF
jgi:protein TonB